jgi:hypothetical protein
MISTASGKKGKNGKAGAAGLLDDEASVGDDKEEADEEKSEAAGATQEEHPPEEEEDDMMEEDEDSIISKAGRMVEAPDMQVRGEGGVAGGQGRGDQRLTITFPHHSPNAGPLSAVKQPPGRDQALPGLEPRGEHRLAEPGRPPCHRGGVRGRLAPARALHGPLRVRGWGGVGWGGVGWRRNERGCICVRLVV